MKWWLYAFFIIVCISCASVNVTNDFDKEVDFSQFKSFNYFQGLNSGLSELDEKRLIFALNHALTSKGLQLTDNPELFVDIKGKTMFSPPNSRMSVGIGGTGSHVGGGVAVGIPVGSSYLYHELIIQFINPDQRGVIWESLVQFKLAENESVEAKEKIFESICAKILQNYPPKYMELR